MLLTALQFSLPTIKERVRSFFWYKWKVIKNEFTLLVLLNLVIKTAVYSRGPARDFPTEGADSFDKRAETWFPRYGLHAKDLRKIASHHPT